MWFSLTTFLARLSPSPENVNYIAGLIKFAKMQSNNMVMKPLSFVYTITSKGPPLDLSMSWEGDDGVEHI